MYYKILLPVLYCRDARGSKRYVIMYHITERYDIANLLFRRDKNGTTDE